MKQSTEVNKETENYVSSTQNLRNYEYRRNYYAIIRNYISVCTSLQTFPEHFNLIKVQASQSTKPN